MIFQIVLQPTQPLPLDSSSGVSMSTVGIVFAVLIALIVGAVAIRKFFRLLRRPELEGLTPEKVKRLWEQIQQSAKQGKLGGKIAIIEADKLVDNVLKSMLIPGETMGERLKMIGHKNPTVRDVWPAHRIRNRLVHETDYELTDREVKTTLEGFRQALLALNVL